MYLYLLATRMGSSQGNLFTLSAYSFYLVCSNTLQPVSILQLLINWRSEFPNKRVLHAKFILSVRLENKGKLTVGPLSHMVTAQRHLLGILSLGLRMKLFTIKWSPFLPFLTYLALSGHLFLEGYLFLILSSSHKFISQYL